MQTMLELLEELRDNECLIVHFSHHAKMRQDGVFPTDLHDAMANSCAWPLSCCLVWPTHSMSLPGSIGLVLRPKSLMSILRVYNSDMGSMTFESGEDGGLGEKLSREALRRTLTVAPNGYNEWRVVQSRAVAIYAEKPLMAKKWFEIPINEKSSVRDIGIQPIQFAEVFNEFPRLPVITRQNGKFIDARTHELIGSPY